MSKNTVSFEELAADLAASNHESPWHPVFVGDDRCGYDWAARVQQEDGGMFNVEFINPGGFIVYKAQAAHNNPFFNLTEALAFARDNASRVYANFPVVWVEQHAVAIIRNTDGYWGFDNWGIPGSCYAGFRWFYTEEAAREWLADYKANELEDARSFAEVLRAGDTDVYHVSWTIPGSGNIDGDDFATYEEAKACYDRMCLDSGRDAKLVMSNA